MSKNLLAKETARIKKMMGFDYKDNSHEVLSEQNIRKAILKEQEVTNKDVNINLPGNIKGRGGKVGISKKEFKKQQAQEEAEALAKIEEGDAAELLKMFAEKFASDLKNSKFFKKLPTDLKIELMNAWIKPGGLPEKFFLNPQKYRFVIEYPSNNNKLVQSGLKNQIKNPIPSSASGEELENIGGYMNTQYQVIDKENFTNYIGDSNTTYKFFEVGRNNRLVIENGKPVIKEVTMGPFRVFVIAPNVGTGDNKEAAASTKTEGTTKQINVNTPRIPITFPVGGSTLTATDRSTIEAAIKNAFNNTEEIVEARKNGATITVDGVNIVASASNSWNNQSTFFTHNLDGSVGGAENQNQPNPTSWGAGSDHLKNFNLAGNRGASLANELQTNEELSQLLQLSAGIQINSQGRVSNTGGQNDTNSTPLDQRGQYANFGFKVTISYTTPERISTLIKLNTFIVTCATQSGSGNASAWGIHFTKAKYLKNNGSRKSSKAISRNLGKSFRGFGSFLDSILP